MRKRLLASAAEAFVENRRNSATSTPLTVKRYDLCYIHNRTILMDIAILLHTVVYAAEGI